MPHRFDNPVMAALRRKYECALPPLQVANGVRADKMPGPQVVSEADADAVKAAWHPLIPGQAVPMVGEPATPDVIDE